MMNNDERQAAAKKAMSDLISTTNSMTGDEYVIQGMFEALAGEHRTLQQSFMRCLVSTLEKYSDCRSDLRNKEAVDFAKEVKAMKKHFSFV